MANRTIKDRLNELPEPYRTQALENANCDLDTMTRSLGDALAKAFVWADSPQGHKYWRKLHKTL